MLDGLSPEFTRLSGTPAAILAAARILLVTPFLLGIVCFRGQQLSHSAQRGGGAGPIPAQGPTVRPGHGRGYRGGPAAAAPREAAPAGGM